MLFENLQDWRSILDNFHRQVENLQIPPANSSSNKTLSLFKSALGHVRQSAIHRILSNFDTAAAHLSFFCQHRFAQGELPDLPSGVDLSQYLNSYVFYFTLHTSRTHALHFAGHLHTKRNYSGRALASNNLSIWRSLYHRSTSSFPTCSHSSQ